MKKSREIHEPCLLMIAGLDGWLTVCRLCILWLGVIIRLLAFFDTQRSCNAFGLNDLQRSSVEENKRLASNRS